MLLLKNAHVYAPQDKGIQDILIGEEKILAMAEGLDENVLKNQFPDLEVKDVEGNAVVPGIIDPHVHITGGGGEASFYSRIAELSINTCLEAGVTTIIGLLGTDGRTRTVGNLVAKARGLSQEGITVYCLTGAYEYPSITLTGDVGDDIVYIPEVLGVKLAISDHRCSNPSEADLTALASKARVASLIGGKAGIVHMHTGVGKNGLKMVVDTVEHTDIPVAHFVPTHIRPETPYVEEFLKLGGGIDLTSGNKPEEAAGYLRHFLTMASPEQITVSSDANGSMPIWNEKKEIVGFTAARLSLLDFLRTLLEEGMSLEEALPFVTENTAKRWKLYPQKGTLQVGSDADMLVLGDGWELESVIAKGKVLR